jgi:hypothetical protein
MARREDSVERESRSRRAEAQDPNRPIDPVTGEKEGLGPRDTEVVETEVTEVESEVQSEA